MDEVADGAATDAHILDQLSRERLDEGRRIMAGLESEQADIDERAHALFDVGQRKEGMRLSGQWELDDRLVRLSAEQQRCLLFAAAERMMVQEYGLPAQCFDWLKDMPLDLVAGDVRLLAAAGNPRAASAPECYRPFGLVLQLTRQLLAARAAGASALPAFLAEMAAGWNVMTWDWPDRQYRHEVAGRRDEAFELAGLAPALPATEGAVGRDDGYGLAVIGWLGVIEDWPEGAAELLSHCATAESARPTARWEEECRQRLDALSDAPRLIRGLLELAVSAGPVSFLSDFGERSVLLGYNEPLLRGVVWTAGLLDEEWMPDLLLAVAIRCLRLCSGHVSRPTPVPGAKVPHACIRSLGRSGTDASLIALAKIGRATSHRGVLKQLGKALAEVSARRGMSAASMTELLTPDINGHPTLVRPEQAPSRGNPRRC